MKDGEFSAPVLQFFCTVRHFENKNAVGILRTCQGFLHLAALCACSPCENAPAGSGAASAVPGLFGGARSGTAFQVPREAGLPAGEPEARRRALPVRSLFSAGGCREALQSQSAELALGRLGVRGERSRLASIDGRLAGPGGSSAGRAGLLAGWSGEACAHGPGLLRRQALGVWPEDSKTIERVHMLERVSEAFLPGRLNRHVE